MVTKAILILVIFFNLILSIFVFTQNTKSLNNRFFSLLSFVAAIWAFTNYMTGIYPLPFWLESTYAFGDLVISIGLLWTLVITDKIFNIKKALTISIFSIIFFYLSYLDGFIAKSYDHIYIGGVFTGVPGWGLWIYTLFYLLWAAIILFKLFIAQNTKDYDKKLTISYVFYGALFTLTITAFTSFIFPSLSIFSFSGLDSIGFLIFLTLIGMSIIKGHLFNIKVITTELVTFILWISVLIRTVISETQEESLINGGLLLLLIIFGILLIRSVLKEVSQRERIEKLAVDLQKANVQLKDLDKQKSEFVSFATHQLRSPLTAMKGYASLILEGDLGQVSDEVKNAIKRIYDSSETLINIVGDYLNISRIELGTMKYTFENFDLKELVDNVIEELRPNIEKSNTKLSFIVDRDKKFIVRIDKDKFKQIIANLVDNSVKYTSAGTVVIKLERKEDMKILLSIKDNGIGIAPEVMPRLFLKFSRSDNANKKNIHGTGLGLFVAKEIVAVHKGRIWAESEGEGKGSTFFVELEVS